MDWAWDWPSANASLPSTGATCRPRASPVRAAHFISGSRSLKRLTCKPQNLERILPMPVRKTTILTADDDPQLLQLMTRTLQLEGYEVLAASDGQQALSLIESRVPDAILLDVMMPKMDGFSVCQRVREFSLVPIIIVTARGQDQDKIRGLDLGADDYLTKPFSVEELLARVRAVLRRTYYSLQS